MSLGTMGLGTVNKETANLGLGRRRPLLALVLALLLASFTPWAAAQESSDAAPTQETPPPAAAEDSAAPQEPEAKDKQPAAEPEAKPAAETKGAETKGAETKGDEAVAAAATVVQSQAFLPNSTCAWISVPNPKALNEMFAATQIGQLVHDESLRPLVDQITEQVRSAMDENAVQYGLRLSRLEDLETGEICLAGILPRDATGAIKPEKRAIVLLVEVSKCKDAAHKLLEETTQELINAGATPSKETVNDIETTKWTFPVSRMRARQRVAHQAIVGDWILASNEGDAFRQVLRWIARPDLSAVETLANDEQFNAMLERSKFGDAEYAEHVRWYIEPFGYLDLARILAEEDQNPATKERSNNFAKIVKESGFDAIQGVSGSLAFNTADHQVLHRSYIFAPPVESAGADRYPKSAAILDFVNKDKIALDPEPWVPANAASYATLTWNFDKVINHVHHVVDAITAEGSFERMLQNVKETNKFDVREVVKHLNNRVSVASEVVEPIDANCEKLVISLGIKGDSEFVKSQVKNFFGHALAVEQVDDLEIYYESVEEEEPDFLFGDEGEGEESEPEPPGLIEKKYVTVHNNSILISNDLEYLKKVITGEPSDLGQSVDYQRIRGTLDKLVDADRVSLRHFGRLDQVLRANYELARRNELRTANTLLARIIAEADAEAVKRGEKPREFNGENMPAYDSYVAPFLGPTGWIVESEDDGWRITSCLLTSNSAREQAEVADKSGQNTSTESSDDKKR